MDWTIVRLRIQASEQDTALHDLANLNLLAMLCVLCRSKPPSPCSPDCSRGGYSKRGVHVVPVLTEVKVDGLKSFVEMELVSVMGVRLRG
jgi:hypothetical protein